MATPTSFLTEEMREQAIGTESKSVTMEVEKGAIVNFAQAIGDGNPLYNDEVAAGQTEYGTLIAPPTFLRCMRAVQPNIPFDLPFERLLDGGSDWEYFQPVRAGDQITAVAEVADISERAGRIGLMIFIKTLITYRNQFDQISATQTNTLIRY
ncbi:MAG: MaoC family dehydratase N-terminal domain-containing protein [Chloroflexi bacterium]|nr:MaoC family dehydratase N-terminal domain-containing protein [Chloroflexota bacterium]